MPTLQIREIGPGQHPSEVMIEISTDDGKQHLIVDRQSIEDKMIEVGYPVGSNEASFLVELPRETSSGLWRVWVNRKSLKHQEIA